LAFGVGEFGFDEEFGEWDACVLEAGCRQGAGGDFAEELLDGGFVDLVEGGAEEDFAGADGVMSGGFAMDHGGDFAGEGFMGFAGAGVGSVGGLEVSDGFLIEEGKELEVADDVAIVGIDPELVEAVDAGFLGVEPDGAADGFAEFTAVGIGDEGEDEAVGLAAEAFAAEVDSCGDIAPLIGAADLEFAVMVAAEDVEVEGLEQHVAELGVADTGFAVFHACADAFFGDHHIDGEVFAGIAEELEVADVTGPGGVIEELGGVGGGIEVEEFGELGFDALDIVIEDFAGEELAFLGFTAGVTDEAGGAAGDGDGVVAGELEAAEGEEGDEVADVEAIGSGVEAAVEGEGFIGVDGVGGLGGVRGGGACGGRLDLEGAIGDEPAPLQFLVDIHRGGSFRSEGVWAQGDLWLGIALRGGGTWCRVCGLTHEERATSFRVEGIEQGVWGGAGGGWSEFWGSSRGDLWVIGSEWCGEDDDIIDGVRAIESGCRGGAGFWAEFSG
jgi:hypothetical protein